MLFKYNTIYLMKYIYLFANLSEEKMIHLLFLDSNV